MHYIVPRASNDDDETSQLPEAAATKRYHHYESSAVSNQIHFYLSGEIGDPFEYTDMIHRIATAGPYDTIYIHLNTPGGRLDTGVQLIGAMKNSQATIVTSLDCNAYSLGTLIFLSGDEMIVNDHCMLMFHDYNSGTGGKGNEQVAQLNATHKWFTNLVKKVYIPFLTEQEVDRILKGEDLWMASPEVKTRLHKMVKILSGEQAAAKKPKKIKELPLQPAV